MSLWGLIKLSDNSSSLPISVDDITDYLISNKFCSEAVYYPVDMDDKIVKAFTEPVVKKGFYGREFKIARIYYSKNLNTCWKRFAVAKELVHLVDPPLFAVDSREKLERLLVGMTSNIMPSAFYEPGSDGLVSDVFAEIAVLPVLIPPNIRNDLLLALNEKRITEDDVAYLARIPKKYIPTVMSDLYDMVVNASIKSPELSSVS